MDKLAIGGELPKNEALVSKLCWESIDKTHGISRGSFGYYIKAITDYYVIKDSEEYKIITNMIVSKESSTSICMYIDTLAITHLQPHEILELIDNIKQKYFDDGIALAQRRIRIALGVYDK